MPNLLSALPSSLSAEITESLVHAKHIRIERIVSQGQASPEGFWYDQDQAEFVVLVQGAGRLRFENEVKELQSGDWIKIPAHRKHRVEWTTPDEQTVWLAVFVDDSRGEA